MEEKKKSRSEKMYSNSPKIEKDEKGKPALKKSEKKSAEASAGTEGVVKDEGALDMHQKHAKERLDLHHKHEKEHAAMTSEHMKQMAMSEGQPEQQTAEQPAAAQGE